MSTTTTLTDIDFLQQALDFSDIAPEEFEKLVFHLLDEMGFSNLVWRKGGDGNSATDGGRDLEGTFWTVRPGVSREEVFWFEVKHRKNQLEKTQVQNTVINASGNHSKDNLIIITNKTISNPTLDWIGEHQKSQRVPNISVWQGHDLELLLRKNPRTLARFLPLSLAFSGRCKIIESKFSNMMLLPAGGELDELWDRKADYYENSYLMLVAIIAEVAYGDVSEHQWGLEIDSAQLFAVAATGMLCVYPFIFKCSALNRDQAPLINGLTYIIANLLLRSGEELCAKILFNPEQFEESSGELPDELKINRYAPILGNLHDDISFHCSENCSKVNYMRRSENIYFQRFVKKEEKTPPTSILLAERGSCSIGVVPPNRYCPLGSLGEMPKSEDELVQKLEFLRGVIISRSNKYRENMR